MSLKETLKVVWLPSDVARYRNRLIERCLEVVAERGLSDTITEAKIQGWARSFELPHSSDILRVIDRLVVEYIEDVTRDVTEVNTHVPLFLLWQAGKCSATPFSTTGVGVFRQCVMSITIPDNVGMLDYRTNGTGTDRSSSSEETPSIRSVMVVLIEVRSDIYVAHMSTCIPTRFFNVAEVERLKPHMTPYDKRMLLEREEAEAEEEEEA